MASQSIQWRKEGNSLYNGAALENLAPILRKDRLEKALKCYVKALQSGENEDETASAAKNVAQSSWKLAHVYMQEPQGIKNMCNYYFRSSIEHFGKAYTYGTDVKDPNWRDGVTQALYKSMQDALDYLLDLDFIERIRILEDYVTLIPIDQYKAEFFIELASALFRHGIVALQNGDYKTCLQDMKKCNYPIEEAKRFSRGQSYILDMTKVLEQDVFVHNCVAESMQARKTGDELLRQLTQDEESINMTLVFTILDWYKQAVLLTREHEVEMEAIALSQIGYVYDKVLKLKYKAKENYMRTIQLAESLHPRIFNSEQWYQQCSEALERYQQEVIQRDEKAKQAEREPFLAELAQELKELKFKSTAHNVPVLLPYIYEKYPPKNPQHKLENKEQLTSADRATLKKALVKAIQHYHPDRQSESEHGKKWVVLSEEITKCLTNIYESYKV